MKYLHFLILNSINITLLSACSLNSNVSESLNEFNDCTDCPSMVKLPVGTYTIGDLTGDGRENERPATEIKIEKPFAISKYPITIGHFRRFVQDTNYKTEAEQAKGCWNIAPDKSINWMLTDFWDNSRMEQTDNHPVVCVSINDALAYTTWLSQKTGAIYSLPTEAQWEYAARAGTQSKYIFGEASEKVCENLNWGDDNTTIMWGGGKELLICDDTFLFTSPVGSFPANNFGLYDMYGNVWEWTIDCYQPNLNHIGVSQATETQCKKHPLRGASFAASLKGTTSTYRISEDPDMRTGDYGFRIIREINL